MVMKTVPHSRPDWSRSQPPAKYFIDAWNASDGAMFASSRHARTDLWDEQSDFEAETFLLRAPDFDAVLVPRALAYGAVRRGSQEGFSLDGQVEVEFDSLAKLRELARRAYVAGAIGDSGPEGDGPPQPGPAPPDTGPEVSSTRQGERGVEDHSVRELAIAVDDLSLDAGGDERAAGLLRLRQALGKAMGGNALEQAALLLLQSADEALECPVPGYASMPLARSFVHLAATLIGWRGLRNAAPTMLIGKQAQRLADLMFDPPWPPHHSAEAAHQQRFDALHLLSEGLLPSYQIRDALKLPPRCNVWIDALEYLSADRKYYQLGPNGEWLPLAVAVATIATSSRMPLDVWWEWAELGRGNHRRFWLEQIVDYIASMIPAGGLQHDVESWVRDRCWLHQRNQSRPRTA